MKSSSMFQPNLELQDRFFAENNNFNTGFILFSLYKEIAHLLRMQYMEEIRLNNAVFL